MKVSLTKIHSVLLKERGCAKNGKLQKSFNKHVKKSFGKLHQETFRRFRLLEEVRYKVVYVWGKDYNTSQ